MTAVIGRTERSRSPMSTTERLINSVTVFPMLWAALFLSPAPTAFAMLTVVPMASPTIMTVSICIICDPTETAVVSATLANCPMMNKSAMP